MPLSSVLGASSVIKPGVCTSTTRPSVPYTGQLIYETDTRRVVAWNGSAWIYETAAEGPPGLVFITSQTIGTAVSSVTVSNVFSSTYDNYRIIWSGGATTSVDQITIQLGSTTSGYYQFLFYGAYNSNTVNGLSQSNGNSFKEMVHGSTNTIFGSVDIYSPNLAKNTFAVGQLARSATTSYSGFASGYLADNTQYTGFTFATSTGGVTMTGGTVRVYGYANS